jgi:hypothetical protein
VRAPGLAARPKGRPRTRAFGPAPARQRDSNFFITVNTNYVPRTDADANRIGADLINAIRQTFDSGDDVSRMITFRAGGTRDFSRITDPKADYRAEIAPRTGMLHAHILFSFKHTVAPPGVHLNIPAVRNAIRSHGETTPVKDLPYINVRGFSSLEDMLAYTTKGDEVDPDFGEFLRTGSL